MPISYEEARAQAATYADDSKTYLDCFEINSSSQSDLLRFVNSMEEFTYDGKTYHPHGFEFDDEDQEPGAVAEAKIVIGFFDPAQLVVIKEAAKEDPAPTGVYSCFEVASDGAVKVITQWAIPMRADSFDIKKGSITINLKGDDFVNPAFFSNFIDVDTYPMLKS